MSGQTLEEAMTKGRGTERPFRCLNPDHEDSNASASVNILKMVWYCYGCHASGVVDKNRVPTAEELLAMLEPDEACVEVAPALLELYGVGGYWAERFPDWVCWLQGFGTDPWTGEGTYPVHTPTGRLAGVAKRALEDGPWPKYRYPYRWSASRTLFGSRGHWKPQDVVVLVEGAADQAANTEVGVLAYATYGSGLHAPQRELVLRMNPRLVLCGYDMDDAGANAAALTYDLLKDYCEVGFIDWKEAKDPADCSPERRLEAVLEAVSTSHYGDHATTEQAARSFVSYVTQLYVEESS